MHPNKRVLLVGGPSSAAHLVRETLARATDGGLETTHVNGLTEALAHLRHARADAVLLEPALPDAHGLDALKELTTAASGLRPVLLVGATETALGEQALGCGAGGYLVKHALWELDAPRLLRALENARRPPGRRGPVLAFLGARGGVGTTSLALSTARVLHRRGHTVALVELSGAPGGLHALLGVEPERHLALPAARVDASLEPASLDDALTDVKPGLRVLLAPREPAPALTPERVQALLASLAAMVHVVVLDLPRDGSPATQAAARAASSVALVLDPEPACIRQARDAVAALASWSVDADRIGLVAAHRQRSVDLSLAELSEIVGAEVLSAVPLAAGRPPEESDPHIRSVTVLAERLMGEDLLPMRARA